MNANLEAIKQEIITGSQELASAKEVYEFRKKFLDGKTGKIGLLMKEMFNLYTVLVGYFFGCFCRFSGTGSYPPRQKGLQRRIRQTARAVPLKLP